MTAVSILIFVSRGRLDAYLIQPDGQAQILKQIDFIHDAQTGVALVEWADGVPVCCDRVSQMIEEILGQYGPGRWALGCPESFGDELVSHLSAGAQQALSQRRITEIAGVDITNVAEWFGGPEPAASV